MSQIQPKYLQAFNDALDNYVNKKDRPGYQPTLLTWFRHSFKKYSALEELENLLKTAENDEKRKKTLEVWLGSNKLTANNHSFRSYLLDQLLKDDSKTWETYDQKTLVFYQGILYRGTLQTPDNAFKYGMKSPSTSENIEDYADDASGGKGVSTSKNPVIARGYAVSVYTTPRGAIHRKGYVYKINYRGSRGIDIIQTLLKRGLNWIANAAGFKKEVNIIDHILPADIESVGYVDDDGTYVAEKANLKYKPNRQADAIHCKNKQLDILFSRRERFVHENVRCAFL